MDRHVLVLVALVFVSSLLTGCAVRTQFQGCLIRCPDAMKDPDQLEAEGQREVLESTPIVGMLDLPPQVKGRMRW